MGGYGSGSWRDRGAGRCESQYRIDLAYMKRQRLLTAGSAGTLSWSCGGERTGWIRYKTLEDRLRLSYRTRPWNGEWRDVHDEVWFGWTRMHFGGRRRWFICPSCGRYCRILYGGAYFRCRRCQGLTYESQYEPSFGRALTQAQNIRERLGGSPSLDDPFPPKPKGMHWKTYARLYEQHERRAIIWNDSILTWLCSRHALP